MFAMIADSNLARALMHLSRGSQKTETPEKCGESHIKLIFHQANLFARTENSLQKIGTVSTLIFHGKFFRRPITLLNSCFCFALCEQIHLVENRL